MIMREIKSLLDDGVEALVSEDEETQAHEVDIVTLPDQEARLVGVVTVQGQPVGRDGETTAQDQGAIREEELVPQDLTAGHLIQAIVVISQEAPSEENCLQKSKCIGKNLRADDALIHAIHQNLEDDQCQGNVLTHQKSLRVLKAESDRIRHHPRRRQTLHRHQASELHRKNFVPNHEKRFRDRKQNLYRKRRHHIVKHQLRHLQKLRQ